MRPSEPSPPDHDGPDDAPARFGTAAPTEAPAVSSRRIALVGTAVWALALVVVLAVPALHTGERSWWPWTCVAGMALGVFAWWFVRRGRGNAAGA
ncbi:MAG: DUF2530 domain-containing protein [Dermatophilaceae bacterium]